MDFATLSILTFSSIVRLIHDWDKQNLGVSLFVNGQLLNVEENKIPGKKQWLPRMPQAQPGCNIGSETSLANSRP